MESNKDRLLRRGVSDQQALVKELQNQTVKAKKFIIPAGRRLLEQIDKTSMATAVFNWLRHTRAFEQVTISFAKDPTKYRRTPEKVYDFDAHAKLPFWEHRDGGKLVLAERIANVINTRQFVALVVKKDGIWIEIDDDGIFKPTNEDGEPAENWEPYVEFIPKGMSTYGH